MGKVRASVSVSVDGFIAGPNDGVDNPLGDGGDRLHQWVYDLEVFRERHGEEGGERTPDNEILQEVLGDVGATVVGRRMFDNAGGWGDDPPFRVPVFVLTHEEREPLAKGETTFTFVNGGIEQAVEQARDAAGGGHVSVGGGGSTIQQALGAGLLDELQLHLVPLLLGGGVRLFGDGGPPVDLERTRVVESTAVTHVRYRVVR